MTLEAHRAVLPAGLLLLAAGGVRPDAVSLWLGVGTVGLGIGPNLYDPEMSLPQLAVAALAYAGTLAATRPTEDLGFR